MLLRIVLRLRWASCVVLFLAVCSPVALAQPGTAGEPSSRPMEHHSDLSYTTPIPHRLTGNEVPDYYLVTAFYDVANGRLTSGVRGWRNFLSLVEIKEGSLAEEALRQGVILGAITTSRRLQLPDPAENPVAFEEMQAQFAGDQRRELAEAFLQLRQALRRAGASSEGVESYIRGRLASGVALGSTEPFGEGDGLTQLDDDFTQMAFGPMQAEGEEQ